VLGLIGTLTTRQKGVHVLLEAAAMVKGKVPEFRVRILGAGDPGPWREEARALGVADVVDFDGVLPAGDAVMRWLDNVDLYVHPSFKEGLPRAVIEAMSRGCPVVASRVGGIPELLEEDCLFRPGDAAELAGKLTMAMTERAWRVTQGDRNWEVAHRYTNETLNRRRYAFWSRFRSFASSARKA